MDRFEQQLLKRCALCNQDKPLTDFRRRSGKGSAPEARRGVCAACRRTNSLHMNKKRTDEATEPIMKSVHQVSSRGTSQGIAEMSCVVQEKFVSPHAQRRIYQHPPRNRTDPSDPGQLRPTRQGTIRMLGFTDQGRRWQQEIDPTLATILVEQHAAVVVNRHTIRRLFSNKDFKQFILSRDDHTCWFCGNFGDTIDHLHPRAKGGHTTPVNCVCACNVCNQIKADRDLHEFLREIDEMRSRTREGITNI